jgi:hypothetical protein
MGLDIAGSGHGIDDEAVRYIKNALHRLHQRGYTDEEDIVIYAGRKAWYEYLNGNYAEMRADVDGGDPVITIMGMPVVKIAENFPDYRVMLVDESATVVKPNVKTLKRVGSKRIQDTVSMGAADGPVPSLDEVPTTEEIVNTTVSTQQLRDPAAIEYVPEFEEVE